MSADLDPGTETELDEGLPLLPGFRQMALRRREVLQQLVQRRRHAGLSQADIAHRMGTSQSAVARFESGGVDARLSTLERYAVAVGVQIEVRLGREGNSPSGGAGTTTLGGREGGV